MTERPRPILDMNRFHGAAATEGLLARRQANAGALSVLFYREPLELVSARGAWVEAADGRRYLDFYNNVPSVGHCHPRVVAAIAEQAGRLAINSRYLSEIVETYAERLKATLPPALSAVALACSGSEANDLALRVAMAATGGTGVIVTEAAYHGNTWATTEVSPSALRTGRLGPHVRTVPAPGAFGADPGPGFAAAVAEAAAELRRAGHAPAAFLCDSIFSSDGVHADPPGFLAAAVDAARQAGALWIADEVQPGFARTGDAFWGFARHGGTPDIVTMGKPIGNGYPMAAMAARPELLEPFAASVGYFNTFGGNPAAAAAGLAVLDVIAEEGLQQNARRQGARLKAGLAALAGRGGRIAAVRGAGLFLGVAFADRPGRPAPALVGAVIEGLKARGVLAGAAGLRGGSLKLRPPLGLTEGEADLFLGALAETLDEAG
jgi:4-aminobutyrate aminotransferase-like enzyme